MQSYKIREIIFFVFDKYNLLEHAIYLMKKRFPKVTSINDNNINEARLHIYISILDIAAKWEKMKCNKNVFDFVEKKNE